MPRGYPGRYVTSSLHSPFYLQGPRKGQPRLCKHCPTVVKPNNYRLNLCATHLAAYELAQLRRKRKVRYTGTRSSTGDRLTACLTALAYPAPGEFGADIRERGGRRNAIFRRWSLAAAKQHWLNLIANHPDRLPPGLDLSNLPVGRPPVAWKQRGSQHSA